MARSNLSKSSLLLCCSAVVLAACPDPQARFDEFVDRTEDVRTGGEGGSGPGTGVIADINGDFLLSIDTPLGRGQFLQFRATAALNLVDGACPAEGCLLDLTVQPLTEPTPGEGCPEPGEPVGDPLRVEDVAVAEDGTFDINWGTVQAPGCANPISGGNIVTTLRMNGRIVDEDVFCGTARGTVSEPVTGSLAGSTFGAVRITGDTLPTVLFECPADNGTGGAGGGAGGAGGGSAGAGGAGGAGGAD